MNDDELMALIKQIDPDAVRVPKGVRELATLIEQAEREECAKVCESFGGNGSGYIDDDWAAMCARAIRAR